MIPAYSYEEICEVLRRKLQKRSKWFTTKSPVIMVGILFARPGSQIVDNEIIPNLDYFHHRSGENIDFFCGGYGACWENRKDEFPDQMDVGRGQYQNWLYSSIKFNAFRKEIENMTNWHYSGAVDLLLTNAKYNAFKKAAYLDYSSSIVCNIGEMQINKVISSVETFFEEIFRFAEAYTGNDPTWAFSDRKGLSLGRSALKRFIIDLLPNNLAYEAKKIEHFAIKDVSKR